MMPAVCADGSRGICVFIIKGAAIRTTMIVGMHGQAVCQTLEDCLPRHALTITRKELAGCDKDNFLEWAKYFVKIEADLTANGRKFCLLFDGYRSYMGFKVLRTLREGRLRCLLPPCPY